MSDINNLALDDNELAYWGFNEPQSNQNCYEEHHLEHPEHYIEEDEELNENEETVVIQQELDDDDGGENYEDKEYVSDTCSSSCSDSLYDESNRVFFKWGYNKQSGECIYINKFMFTKQRENKKTTSWLCACHCGVSASVFNNEVDLIAYVFGEHSHDPLLDIQIDCYEAKANIKYRAANERLTPSKIYEDEVAKLVQKGYSHDLISQFIRRGSRGGRGAARGSRGGRGAARSSDNGQIDTRYDYKKEISEFVDYFTSTWYRGWSIEEWNVNDCIGPPTNNHVEGFHHDLNQRLPKNHPDVYSLINVFKDIEETTSIEYHRRLNGGDAPRQRQDVKQKEKLYQNILNNWNNGFIDVPQFLNAATQLIGFKNSRRS